MSSQPGEAGIPYTHREVFLAAPNAVGQGLDTFGEIGNTALQNQDTIGDIFDNDNARPAIKENDKVFEELLKSKYLHVNFESEMTALYLERNAPNIWREEGYTDIHHLVNNADLTTWSEEDVQWFIGIQLAYESLQNKTNLYNNLIQNQSAWVKYWKSMEDYDKWNSETLGQIAKYCIGDFNDTYYQTFQNSNNIVQLLQMENGFQDPTHADEINTTHPTLINNRGVSYNPPSQTSFGEFLISNADKGRWIEDADADPYEQYSGQMEKKASPYTNNIAIAFLHRSPELRRSVAAGNLSVDDPNFTFGKLINGEYDISFANALKNHLYDELIMNANTDSSIQSYSTSGYYAFPAVEIKDGSITVQGKSQNPNQDVAADASLDLHPIDVAQYDSILLTGSIKQSNNKNSFIKMVDNKGNTIHHEAGTKSDLTLQVDIKYINQLAISMYADVTRDHRASEGKVQIDSIELL